MIIVLYIFLSITLLESSILNCNNNNIKCQDAKVVHFFVHPHLDAFWIYTFDDYYLPQRKNGYMISNRFTPVKDIFRIQFDVQSEALQKRKKLIQNKSPITQQLRRTFANSEVVFFKRWVSELNQTKKNVLKQILHDGYWEILGGGWVQNDQASAYYDDIIDNFQIGLRYLKTQFNYTPNVAISTDSFGHSQTMAAILSQIGINAYIMQRNDQHVVNQVKNPDLQYVWRAVSQNNIEYGFIVTHLRWTIHGYEECFSYSETANQLSSKNFAHNIISQINYFDTIYRSSDYLRYFGHDFQRFGKNDFQVIQNFINYMSTDICNNLVATYTTPSQFFNILYHKVFKKKVKQITSKTQDIFPIWDYDSALYWTGYFTTNPRNKLWIRNAGRMLQTLRKAFFLNSFKFQTSDLRQQQQTLEKLQEAVALQQHHDGITSTSKYSVHQYYQKNYYELLKKAHSILQKTFKSKNQTVVYQCESIELCKIQKEYNRLLLHVFNSGGSKNAVIRIQLCQNCYYQLEESYNNQQILCPCEKLPCKCFLYILAKLSPALNKIKLKKTSVYNLKVYYLEQLSGEKINQQGIGFNKTHIIYNYLNNNYAITYAQVQSGSSSRNYIHYNRFGGKSNRHRGVTPGKYALVNNPQTFKYIYQIKQASIIKGKIFTLCFFQSQQQLMLTHLQILNSKPDSIQIKTHYSARIKPIMDYYIQISSNINNQGVFYTDSNGWLVMKRKMYYHQNYSAFFDNEKKDLFNGNTYPISSFIYIKDQNNKISVNTDRGQGALSKDNGKILIHFDRITLDDGKWVYQNEYRSNFNIFRHTLNIGNASHYKQRQIQKDYDQMITIRIQQIQQQQQSNNVNQYFQKLSNQTRIGNVKFIIRNYGKNVILRIQNLHDRKYQFVNLFNKNLKMATFLSSFLHQIVKYEKIKQLNLAANIQYKQMLQKKSDWSQLIQINTSIYDKVFAQNILLRPLQIRVFQFINISIQKNSLNILTVQNETQIILFYNYSKPPSIYMQSITMKEQRKKGCIKKNIIINDKQENQEKYIKQQKNKSKLQSLIKQKQQQYKTKLQIIQNNNNQQQNVVKNDEEKEEEKEKKEKEKEEKKEKENQHLNGTIQQQIKGNVQPKLVKVNNIYKIDSQSNLNLVKKLKKYKQNGNCLNNKLPHLIMLISILFIHL